MDTVTASNTVLVADPDWGWRSDVLEALRRIGYGALESSTGTTALKLARQRRPGLVVIDVALPGITGYELCYELRQEFGEGFPIIFVSAERTESFDRVGGLLVGADDYVVKPCLSQRAPGSHTAAFAPAAVRRRERDIDPHRQGRGGAAAARCRLVHARDRRRACHQHQDRRRPRSADPHEAGCAQPSSGRSEGVSRRTRRVEESPPAGRVAATSLNLYLRLMNEPRVRRRAQVSVAGRTDRP